MNEFLSKENGLLQKARRENNWLIEDGDDNTSVTYAIYCSSNGIYYPNDAETFTRRILQQNKFDWRSNRFRGGIKKHIYIRDIYKQWYIEGINEDLNSIEKVAEWIRSVSEEHAEYVFLGSSAGGYMCICLASILGGTVFAGSPQIYLKPAPKYPILSEHYANNDTAWFDLKKVLSNSAAENYIFYGMKNEEDRLQIETLCLLDNVHMIPFDSDVHGVVFFPFNAKYFYSSLYKMKALSSSTKAFTRLSFSVYIAGVGNTIRGLVKAAANHISHRIRRGR